MDIGPAKDYLMKHNVHLLFETLAGELIGQRPGQPLDYLIRRLQEIKAGEGGAGAQKIIFVLGGPGSGKGTQCARLVQEKGCIHISAGDLLRAEVRSGSELGVSINDHIKNGQIVPGHITIDLLGRAIREKSSGPGQTFLIDGFPRELKQALDFLKEVGEPSFVLNFTASDKELERRLLQRGQFSGRSDDNLEAIQKRLVVFHKQTEPVIAYFDALKKVKSVNAMRPVEEVAAETLKCLE